MPTYDYICKACDQSFEIFHSMKEADRTDCPSCGEATLQKKIGTGAGIIFKGSGFYETDYRKTQSGDASKGSESTSEKTESKNSKEPKADAKAPKRESTATG